MSLENKVMKFTAKVLPLYTAFYFTAAPPVFSQPTSDSMHHMIVGNLYRNEGELDNAFRSYLKALKHDPKSAYINNSIAEVLIDDGHLEFALSYLNDAVKLDKEFLDARMNLASIYIIRKDFNKALKEVEFVLSSKPDNSLALLYAGESMFHLNNFSEARKYFDKVISLDNNFPDRMYAYQMRGKVNFNEGKFRHAIKDFEKSLYLADVSNLVDRLLAYNNLFLVAVSHFFLKEYQESDEALHVLLGALKSEKDDSVFREMINHKGLHDLKKLLEEVNQSSSKKETPNTAIPR